MWSRLKHIASQSIKQWKPILFIYAMQLILGVIVAISAYVKFDGAIGNSLELDRLAKGFDRSIFSDIINEFPTIIANVQSRFGMSVMLFLLLSTFLHAGLLGNIRKDEFSISSFLINAKKYFLKFLGVVLISIFKMIVLLSIIWVPFMKWMGDPLETFHSEKTLILTIIGLLTLSVLFIVVIWLWSVLSRYQIVDGDAQVISMKSGWRLLKSNFVRYYAVGIGLILLHVLVTWVYTQVVDDWGAETWFCVLGLVVIQQIFSFVRIFFRVLGYSAINISNSNAAN